MDHLKRILLIGGMGIWAFWAILGSRADHGDSISAIVSVVVRLAAGIIVVSGGVAFLDRRFPGRAPDSLVASAWSIGRGMILALLVLSAAALFTGGIATTLPGVVIGVLLAGASGGIAHAWWRSRLIGIAPAGRASAGRLNGSLDHAPRQPSNHGLRFLWFVFGCFAALLLLVPVASIANGFRGPTDGITELGTWDFVQDQRPVNRAIGMAVADLGWLIGLVLRARRSPSQLIAGLILTATLLGFAWAIMPR